MLEAVIFDMDGVIIDSEPVHFEINQEIFRRLGISIPGDIYYTFVGISNTKMWTIIKENFNLSQTVPELLKTHLNVGLEYLKEYKNGPIPGVVELLEELKTVGIPAGIASSSPAETIKLVTEILGVSRYFSVLASGEEVKNGKPAPDVFLRTAELLKAGPENCVVIEDSKNGVRAAKAAGMKCVGFQNVNSGNQDLTGADLIISSMEDLNIKRLEELCN